MFARSATSERTAALSSRWTASASRESAPKTDPPSIADKLRIRSAFSLIRRLRASLKSWMKLDLRYCITAACGSQAGLPSNPNLFARCFGDDHFDLDQPAG